MKIFDKDYVEAHLDSQTCVELMRKALCEESSGESVQYVRTAINLPNTNVLGIMPGYYHRGYFGAKIISVYHTNGGTGYPSHQGEIILFSAEHGEVLAIVDAMSVTKIRTGAVSAAVTKALARPQSSVLAILGCGAQGHSHLAAISGTMNLTQVRCWDPYEASARNLANAAASNGIDAVVCATAEEAVRDADIVCTVTPSRTPILRSEWVKNGAHINAVGACAPDARELDSELMKRGRVFCDSVESVFKESGDLLIPMNEGLYGREHLAGTVGEVLLGKAQGRTSDSDVTIFDALGMAVEDIACAIYLYEKEE